MWSVLPRHSRHSMDLFCHVALVLVAAFADCKIKEYLCGACKSAGALLWIPKLCQSLEFVLQKVLICLDVFYSWHTLLPVLDFMKLPNPCLAFQPIGYAPQTPPSHRTSMVSKNSCCLGSIKAHRLDALIKQDVSRIEVSGHGFRDSRAGLGCRGPC